MASDSAACRILILSSTLDKAQQFVQRVKTLSGGHSGVGDSVAKATSDIGSTSIPWTITNKYYTADVHFETREIHTFAGYHASEVPAIIYVWNRGEPYKEHVPTIYEKLQHYEPEVTLAVRFSDSSEAPSQDDEDGLDEFLSTHGFEYIDGDRSGRQPTQDGTSFSDEDSSAIPGLPRVIDALSTIMWPSLVQSASTSTRKSRARELLDWAREEEADDGLRALISQDTLGSAENGERKSRMQREMEELERWLEEEDHGRRIMDDAQAWTARDADDTSTSGGWSNIPTPTIRTPAASAGQEDFGFEDDFAEFVGAPVDVSYTYEAPRQEPMYTGASYHSLASHSDLSADDVLNTNHDPDLPSRTEIEETSKRIFGAASLDVPSTSHARRSPQAKPSTLPPGATSPAQGTFPPPDDDSFSSFDETDDEFELGAFDLSRVLGALQGMKEEIAGMTSETERRKAAARVALGLVYGLRKEDERERGPEDL